MSKEPETKKGEVGATEASNPPREEPSGKKMGPYVSRSKEELKQIAVDMHAGRIFSSDHFHERELQQMLPLVFMCLMFGGAELRTWLKDNKINLVYEYMSEAGPRMINGNPVFASVKFLNEDDHKTVREFIAKLQEAIDAI